MIDPMIDPMIPTVTTVTVVADTPPASPVSPADGHGLVSKARTSEQDK